MRPNTKSFGHFFPNIECIPFSNVETCNILNISNVCFDKASKQGLIQKSAKIHYRLDSFFNFIGIFDIFEYALRRDLFFLNYGALPEVSELVCSLVDEFVFIIDDCHNNKSLPQIDRIKRDIIIVCMDNSEKWREYWLYDGDPFSATKCSAIALQTWCTTFEKTMNLIKL